mmetsp:Transcript_6908/g.14973  ORF Transcript_6908/g.14973 Transcript_6908/m.14973 type:complete len:443 (-) Transcript_6908:51-1379(-)
MRKSHVSTVILVGLVILLVLPFSFFRLFLLRRFLYLRKDQLIDDVHHAVAGLDVGLDEFRPEVVRVAAALLVGSPALADGPGEHPVGHLDLFGALQVVRGQGGVGHDVSQKDFLDVQVAPEAGGVVKGAVGGSKDRPQAVVQFVGKAVLDQELADDGKVSGVGAQDVSDWFASRVCLFVLVVFSGCRISLRVVRFLGLWFWFGLRFRFWFLFVLFLVLAGNIVGKRFVEHDLVKNVDHSVAGFDIPFDVRGGVGLVVVFSPLLDGRDAALAYRTGIVAVGHFDEVFSGHAGEHVARDGHSRDDVEQQEVHEGDRVVSKNQAVEVVPSQRLEGLVGRGKDRPGVLAQVVVELADRDGLAEGLGVGSFAAQNVGDGLARWFCFRTVGVVRYGIEQDLPDLTICRGSCRKQNAKNEDDCACHRECAIRVHHCCFCLVHVLLVQPL